MSSKNETSSGIDEALASIEEEEDLDEILEDVHEQERASEPFVASG